MTEKNNVVIQDFGEETFEFWQVIRIKMEML